MNDGRTQRVKAHVGRALLAVILLSALAGVLWYRHQAREAAPEAPADTARSDSKAEMVARDFKHVETRMDRTVWVLEAKKAEMFEDTAKLSIVKITWYGEQPGQMPVVITSRTGRVNFNNRNAVLIGGVRCVRSDGATLVTERVEWDDGHKTLTAPLPVWIESRDLSFHGKSMEVNVEREWVRLSGEVQGEVRPSRGGHGAGQEGGRGANG